MKILFYKCDVNIKKLSLRTLTKIFYTLEEYTDDINYTYNLIENAEELVLNTGQKIKVLVWKKTSQDVIKTMPDKDKQLLLDNDNAFRLLEL